MKDAEFYGAGFEELEKLLSDFSKRIDNPLEIIEVGASEFVNDIKKLPRPRSSLSGAGYTHLLDTATYEKTESEIEVGWGKYYGPMVEKGTKRMSGTPHLEPTFEMNKEKYYKKIKEKLYGGI